MTKFHKQLIAIYVFVNGMTPAAAQEMVACYDNEYEVRKTLEVYKKPFHSRRHSIDERVPFIAA